MRAPPELAADRPLEVAAAPALGRALEWDGPAAPGRPAKSGRHAAARQAAALLALAVLALVGIANGAPAVPRAG